MQTVAQRECFFDGETSHGDLLQALLSCGSTPLPSNPQLENCPTQQWGEKNVNTMRILALLTFLSNPQKKREKQLRHAAGVLYMHAGV